MYVYPAQDLDRPDQLSSLLGSFWSGVYEGKTFVQQFAYVRAQLEQQSGQNLQEAIATLSRFQLPVYHTDLWYQLVLRESQLNAKNFSIHLERGGVALPPADGDNRAQQRRDG